jgi:hypothetical protein
MVRCSVDEATTRLDGKLAELTLDIRREACLKLDSSDKNGEGDPNSLQEQQHS